MKKMKKRVLNTALALTMTCAMTSPAFAAATNGEIEFGTSLGEPASVTVTLGTPKLILNLIDGTITSTLIELENTSATVAAITKVELDLVVDESVTVIDELTTGKQLALGVFGLASEDGSEWADADAIATNFDDEEVIDSYVPDKMTLAVDAFTDSTGLSATPLPLAAFRLQGEYGGEATSWKTTDVTVTGTYDSFGGTQAAAGASIGAIDATAKVTAAKATGFTDDKYTYMASYLSTGQIPTATIETATAIPVVKADGTAGTVTLPFTVLSTAKSVDIKVGTSATTINTAAGTVAPKADGSGVLVWSYTDTAPATTAKFIKISVTNADGTITIYTAKIAVTPPVTP